MERRDAAAGRLPYPEWLRDRPEDATATGSCFHGRRQRCQFLQLLAER